MISDTDLHRLAMFLGSCAMMMVVLYHFLEVNAQDDESVEDSSVAGTVKSSGDAKPAPIAASAGGRATATTSSADATSRKSR